MRTYLLIFLYLIFSSALSFKTDVQSSMSSGSGSDSSQGAMTWSVQSPSNAAPPASGGQTSVPNGGNLYVFGGCSTNTCYNTLYMYNTATQTWSQPASTGTVPTPRGGHTAAIYGSNMYVFGGSSTTVSYMNDFYAYNILSGVWTTLTYAGVPPSARTGQGMTADNEGRLIIFGGYTQTGYVNDLHIADTITQLWSSPFVSGTAPPAREEMSFTFYPSQNSVYMFGGQGTACYNDLWVLDLSVPSWNNPTTQATGNNLPPAREGHLAILDDTTLYIAMGCNFGATTCYSDTWSLNLGTLWWTSLSASATSALTPSYQMSYSVIGQYIYAFGGCYLSTSCDNTMQVFNDNDPCPNNCYGANGVCRNGACMCSAGWCSNDCSQNLVCPGNCNAQGACQATGTCQCYPGYSGTLCAALVNCPSNCTSATNGICQSSGTCQCNAGFSGPSCSTVVPVLSCPNACSSNGVCNTQTGVCQCAPYASRPSCSIVASSAPSAPAVPPVTPTNTTSTTNTTTPTTSKPMFMPINAQVSQNYVSNLPPPTSSSSSDGAITPVMFGGVAPAEVTFQQQQAIPPVTDPLGTCPNGCSSNGVCVSGTCYCEKGFVGNDCSQFKGQLVETGKTYQQLYEYSGICAGIGFVIGLGVILWISHKGMQMQYMDIKGGD